MNQVRLLLLLLGSFGSATVARAAPPSEETRACVAASTRGQTDRDEGRLLAAREQLLSCAHETCPAIVKKSCAGWLSELGERIPSVVVRIHEAGQRDVTDARVTLDGRAITLDGRPVALDPGTHALSVEVPGAPAVERTFLLAERERGRLIVVELPAHHVEEPPLALPPSAKAPTALARAAPEGSRGAAANGERSARAHDPFSVPTGAWALGGVGVIGIVSFVAVRTKAANDLEQLLRRCSPDCSDRERDAGNRKTLAADVSLGLGVAALAGASAWTLGSWLAQRRYPSTRAHAALISLLPARGGAFAAIAARY